LTNNTFYFNIFTLSVINPTMNKLKYILLSLLSFTCISHATQWANRAPSVQNSSAFLEINIKNSNEVRYLFNNLSAELVKEYNTSDKIAFEMMDASDSAMLNFFNHVTQRKNSDHLAMTYFDKFIIDGETLPTCFVFYEPSKNIFNSYISSGFSQEEAFTYLVSHEMAHCFFKHKGIQLDPQGDEIIADLFAIAHSMNNNRYNQVVKIIKFTKHTENPIHSNGIILEKFFLQANQKNLFAEKKSPQEIMQLVLNYFKDNFSSHIIKFNIND